MVDHLTALVLDTVAAGLPFSDLARVHLEGCGDCRTRLDAVKTQRAVAMQSSRFAAGLKRVAPAPVRRLVPVWAVPAVGLALAAGLLLLVGSRFLPAGDEDRLQLKGAVTVELLKDGVTAVTAARVGDKVTLAVGGAGGAVVLVLAVSEDGLATVLEASHGRAGKGASVPIANFEVTAGSLALFACFDDQPLPVEALREELGAGAARLKSAGKSPLELEPPILKHGQCAKTQLVVAP